MPFETIRWSRGAGILGQCLIGVLGMLLVATFPPKAGAMLIRPIGPEAERRAIIVALDHGARIVRRGPLGSLEIDGERERLAGPLLRAGVLVMAGPRSGCGSGRRSPWKN